MSLPKIIVVCGPTATGKSDKAVEIAKKVNGEIVSADSRQVYKGLDIGSGKITKREMKGVPHYLLDVANPKNVFTVADFQKLATEKIEDILSREKTPIICGGTGFYIDTVINQKSFPDVPPNTGFRLKVKGYSAEKLLRMLKKLDPKRAKTVDQNNPIRLIRAIEIAKALGKVPKIKSKHKYEAEIIYMDFPDELLKERINKRLLKRVKQGMIEEVYDLHKKGLTWKRMEALGLEYRYVSLFLQKKITKKEMLEKLNFEIWHYAKRQRTWFKKYLK